MKSIFIGFDFSMNKPACTILYDKKFYHYIWPLLMKPKVLNAYQLCGVFVRCRNLESIPKNNKSSALALEHTKRSVLLANMIVEDLEDFITNIIKASKDTPIYISSEGLSFGSKGDLTVNLATYKGVLLAKLYEHFYGRLYGLYTYAPISLKSTAGCARKNEVKSKTPMIDAFIRDTTINTLFHNGLITKLLVNKTSYMSCVDDIVDSYWALMTMLKREGFCK